MIKLSYPKNEINKSGIYIITNTINNKLFIGCSISIGTTILIIKKMLQSNVFARDILQNDFNEFKEDSFIVDILEYCPTQYLDKEKRRFINMFNTIQFGYNTEYDYNIRLEYFPMLRPMESPFKGRKRSEKFSNNVKKGLREYYNTHKNLKRKKWTKERRRKYINERGLKTVKRINAIPDDIVRNIKIDINSGMKLVDIGKKYNIESYRISFIKNNKSYKYITI